MRKLVKIEVSELGDDLLATDSEGNVYPISYETVQETAAASGFSLPAWVEESFQNWGSCTPDYIALFPNDDWQTIYEAEQ